MGFSQEEKLFSRFSRFSILINNLKREPTFSTLEARFFVFLKLLSLWFFSGPVFPCQPWTGQGKCAKNPSNTLYFTHHTSRRPPVTSHEKSSFLLLWTSYSSILTWRITFHKPTHTHTWTHGGKANPKWLVEKSIMWKVISKFVAFFSTVDLHSCSSVPMSAGGAFAGRVEENHKREKLLPHMPTVDGISSLLEAWAGPRQNTKY